MSYDISLYTSEGPIGDMWITPGSAAGMDVLLKEVCESYPSRWDGRTAEEMYHVAIAGLARLVAYYDELTSFYTPEQIADATGFLERIAKNCADHPDARVEVISG